MNYRIDLLINEAEEMIGEISPKTADGRKHIRRLLRMIEIAEAEADDFADLLSELDLMRRQYASYPPMPLDDGDDDYEDEN